MNRREAHRALAAVVLAASLTGCMKIDMSLDIQEDESIDGNVILAVSEELAELAGVDQESLAEQLRTEVMEDAPEGVTEEPYEDEQFQGTRVVMDGVPLDELDFSDDDQFAIVHEGDEYRVDGVLDLTGADQLEGLAEDQLALFDDAAESMDVRIAITFPGEVLEHNGELDGRTVTWTPEFGENVDIEARAEDSSGTSFPWLVAGVVAGVLLIGAVAVVALRRRAGAAPSTPVATAADGPIRDQEMAGEFTAPGDTRPIDVDAPTRHPADPG